MSLVLLHPPYTIGPDKAVKSHLPGQTTSVQGPKASGNDNSRQTADPKMGAHPCASAFLSTLPSAHSSRRGPDCVPLRLRSPCSAISHSCLYILTVRRALRAPLPGARNSELSYELMAPARTREMGLREVEQVHLLGGLGAPGPCSSPGMQGKMTGMYIWQRWEEHAVTWTSLIICWGW